MKTDQEISIRLQIYVSLVKLLVTFIGPKWNVILHEVRNIENSIVAIENSNISERNIGNSLKDLPLSPENTKPICRNYQTRNS